MISVLCVQLGAYSRRCFCCLHEFTKSSKEKVHFTSKIIYQFLYCHLSRRNYSRKLNCFQSFGFYALFSDCISWYFIDFMELKSKLCAWIHIFFDVPPTVIKICASQILRLAVSRYALEYTKNALGEKCGFYGIEIQILRLDTLSSFMCLRQ